MYDDLARSQTRTTLEWVALNVAIPSAVLTMLLSLARPVCGCSPIVRLQESISYDVLPAATSGPPRSSPVLVSIHRPDYPPEMLRRAQAGVVVLQAVVDERGRVRRESIAVVQTTDARFEEAARRALRSAVFWPAGWQAGYVASPVTVAIAFNLDHEVTYARD